MHYGEQFLAGIKKDSMYGEYFSFEQYIALRDVETCEQFAVFIGTTKYAGVKVYADPDLTYEDFRLVAAEMSNEELVQPLMVLAMWDWSPFLVLVRYFRRKRILRERHELHQRALKLGMKEFGAVC